MKKRSLELIMAVVLLLCVALVSSRPERWIATMHHKQEKKFTVIIDPGHGGNDPGKVGVNNALEKDINLKIASKLEELLKAQDVAVIMTRDTDKGLYQQSSKNKKVEDMRNRCALIAEKKPDAVISIHQNSYHEEYVSGSQVFYYSHSEEGKNLAEIIQKQLAKSVDKENDRVAKANDSYYMLKKTTAPTVIVECGFLSNYEESSKLIDEAYQQKLAWAIHLAVLQYLNSQVNEAK